MEDNNVQLFIGIVFGLCLINIITNNSAQHYTDDIINPVPNPVYLNSCRKLKNRHLIKQVTDSHGFIHDKQKWDLYISCKDDYPDGTMKQLNIKRV